MQFYLLLDVLPLEELPLLLELLVDDPELLLLVEDEEDLVVGVLLVDLVLEDLVLELL